MKKKSLKPSILLMLPFLTGCAIGGTRVISDNTTAFFSTTNLTGSSIYFSCQKCNGETVYEIKVKENTELNIYGTAKIDSGSLTFLVTDVSEEQKYYQNVFEEGRDYQIPVPEYGKYHISITYNDFKGSYKLTWNN